MIISYTYLCDLLYLDVFGIFFLKWSYSEDVQRILLLAPALLNSCLTGVACSHVPLLQTASDCFRFLTPFTFFNVFHLFHQGAQGAEGRMDRGTGGLPQALGSSAPEALSPGGCGGHHSHLEPSWSCQALPNGQFDLHILEALRTESDRVWQSLTESDRVCQCVSHCLTVWHFWSTLIPMFRLGLTRF